LQVDEQLKEKKIIASAPIWRPWTQNLYIAGLHCAPYWLTVLDAEPLYQDLGITSICRFAVRTLPL
jgi:hypothetical protein